VRAHERRREVHPVPQRRRRPRRSRLGCHRQQRLQELGCEGEEDGRVPDVRELPLGARKLDRSPFRRRCRTGQRHPGRGCPRPDGCRPAGLVLLTVSKKGSAVIHYVRGDILEADAEALVNTVNSVGVMGRGIALQFKRAYPGNFKEYASACKRGEIQPGRMFVFDTGELTNPRYIINFPTKVDWRGKSRIEHIESGLNALIEEIKTREIKSIAIPPLGSGLGGLNWNSVRPLIERAMAEVPEVDVAVYEPVGAPAPKPVSTPRPRMTAGRASLVALMSRYLRGLLDPTINLLEVHKLMYFLQEAGEDLRLRYAAGFYGPYAENLRHVLLDVEGHLISGYTGEGDSPDIVLNL